jgi:ABC-type transport system involved in multi-copper enzyme maturation permease subunit
MARFDVARVLRQKMGRFFGFVFLAILCVQLAVLYTKHLIGQAPQLSQLKDFADQVIPTDAAFQASMLHNSTLTFLWFLMAYLGGGLISRDTLYRIRPLVYAHPVGHLDYLASKALVAFGIPFCIQLPFILLPWALSLLMAGAGGPIWPTLPLHLIPAAALTSAVMAAVALGASSMSGTPKAGVGWAVGLLLGPSAAGGVLSGLLENSSWMALSPLAVVDAWPKLMCGVEKTVMPLWLAILATAANAALWLYIAKRRTEPSEAVI